MSEHLGRRAVSSGYRTEEEACATICSDNKLGTDDLCICLALFWCKVLEHDLRTGYEDSVSRYGLLGTNLDWMAVWVFELGLVRRQFY